jgi:probable regulatory domain-containing protein
MKVIEPSEIQEKDVDAIAVRVFLKALEILGGPRKLIEYRNLTWLPSLMVASYAVVLSNESYKTADEIAQFLGSTKNTIRNMLKAETEILKEN